MTWNSIRNHLSPYYPTGTRDYGDIAPYCEKRYRTMEAILSSKLTVAIFIDSNTNNLEVGFHELAPAPFYEISRIEPNHEPFDIPSPCLAQYLKLKNEALQTDLETYLKSKESITFEDLFYRSPYIDGSISDKHNFDRKIVFMLLRYLENQGDSLVCGKRGKFSSQSISENLANLDKEIFQDSYSNRGESTYRDAIKAILKQFGEIS